MGVPKIQERMRYKFEQEGRRAETLSPRVLNGGQTLNPVELRLRRLDSAKFLAFREEGKRLNGDSWCFYHYRYQRWLKRIHPFVNGWILLLDIIEMGKEEILG